MLRRSGNLSIEGMPENNVVRQMASLHMSGPRLMTVDVISSLNEKKKGLRLCFCIGKVRFSHDVTQIKQANVRFSAITRDLIEETVDKVNQVIIWKRKRLGADVSLF